MSRIIRKLSVLLLLLAIVLSACASPGPKPTLGNISQIDKKDAVGTLLMGPFIDKRADTSGGPTYIGSIRGGFGNPVEHLYLTEGIPAFVSENISKSLWNSKIRTEEIPAGMTVYYDGHFTLKRINDGVVYPNIVVGVVQSMQALQNFFHGKRYFETTIDLYLINSTSGQIQWQGKISNNTDSSKYNGAGSVGSKGNTQPTREWLAKLIQDGAIEAFNNIKVLAAPSKADGVLLKPMKKEEAVAVPFKGEAPNPSSGPNLADQLATLKKAKEQGLLTDSEYEQKRKEILNRF